MKKTYIVTVEEVEETKSSSPSVDEHWTTREKTIGYIAVFFCMIYVLGLLFNI
jgi:hypothetical protein